MCPSREPAQKARGKFSADALRIRPATPADRRAVYEWMTAPGIVESMMGPPTFSDAPAPTWEQFCADYVPCYFDGADERFGRSFIIDAQGRAVGHISYSRVESDPDTFEIDIWMRSRGDCSRGLGSAAINLLCERLHTGFDARRIIMRPSARNARAIRAYRKAGFEFATLGSAEQARRYGPGDYADTVVFIRTFGAVAGQASAGSGREV